MKCKQAMLVLNPRAGQNLAKITDVLAVFAAAGWKTDLALKEYGGQTMNLATKAAQAGDDLVIAYGGDGTLNQVVNGVMHAKGGHSIVGLIPGGTANVWAGEISMPSDPVKAALTLVESDARKVDIGHVEVEGLAFPAAPQNEQQSKPKRRRKVKTAPRAKDHFLLMAGLGIDAAVMGHVSKTLKYRVGPLAVGVSAAQELPAQHPFPVEIRAGGTDVLWKGEALQVVIGNTRQYANIVQMTPDAYIDDGILDVCVLTAGDPLTTMQQLVSLLLRHTPDHLSAEYFHGAHLSISVPASIALQLDGSAVKLKDYLSKADREALVHADDVAQVMVTYLFATLPHALQVAIPRAYDDSLFQASDSADQQPEESAQAPAEQKQDQSSQQQKDEQLQDQQQHHGKQSEQERQEALEQVKALLSHGRKVTVVGISANPGKKEAYIVAGSTTKQRTGETLPVAVSIGKRATVRRQTGEDVASAVVRTLHEGDTIVVEGKRSKRGTIRATQVVI